MKRATSHCDRFDSLEGLDRRCETLQFESPEIAIGEQATGDPLRGLGDDDGVGRGNRLQPGGQVRGFADDIALPRRALADQIADHDETGGDADPRLHPRIVWQFDAAYFRQDADCGANGTLCRILEGTGKTEIGQNAIAHELGDEAAVSPDRAGGGVLIAPDQTAEQFGVDFA